MKPLEVIDLLSDSEDESPKKAAQTALNSFAPRKDPRKDRQTGGNGRGSEAEARAQRNEEFVQSSDIAASSALGSFQPRKEKHDEKSRSGLSNWSGQSLSNGYGAESVRAGFGKGGQSSPLANGLGGLPIVNPAKTRVTLDPPQRTVKPGPNRPQHLSGTSIKPKPLTSYANGQARDNVPAEGSLAALLQQAQSPVKATRHESTDARRGSVFTEARTKRADDYYQQYLSQKSGMQNGHSGLPQGARAAAQSRDSARRPTPQAPDSPLKIVDLFKIPGSPPADVRPFKRPRLSEPGQGVQYHSEAISTRPRNRSSNHASPRTSPPKRAVPLKERTAASSTEAKTQPFSKGHHLSSRRPAVHVQNSPEGPTIRREQASLLEQPTTAKADLSTHDDSVLPKPAPTAASITGTSKHVDSAQQLLKAQPAQPMMKTMSGAPSNFGNKYTPEEDALLAELKKVKNLRWEEMPPYFQGRTCASLQFRYSSKVSKRNREPASSKPHRPSPLVPDPDNDSDAGAQTKEVGRRRRKKRNNETSAADGMISWAEVRRRRQVVDEESETESRTALPQTNGRSQFQGQRANAKSTLSILRHRELGVSMSRSPPSALRSIPDELKEHIYDDIGPLRFYKGTSGDVTCLAWSPNGKHFAAGSIAISDDRSMQYNRPGNLLIGNHERGVLHELPEHHVSRPNIAASSDNVNALHSMRESQDPRLFMTVANVQFSPDGQTLYSAGTDSQVRAYNVAGDDGANCSDAIPHSAPLDLLSVSNLDVLATACHHPNDGSIGIYNRGDHMLALSPSRLDQQTSRAIYPSALRWGVSSRHQHLLLAGFSIDSYDEERDIAGETCLWDCTTGQRIGLPVTRNVFDVAWNPRPSSTSTMFAVASTPGSQKVQKGTRTVVQCFAPSQGLGRASRVLEWECPAFDINDVVYCQHNDNLVAAGATDGKVYVWDQRYVKDRPTPLHVFKHGNSLNVLDHDRPREVADTGIRFLSWGATSTRLYTGSSDGVVKIWNPYMASENAHTRDVATFDSAVMSGAFSPDYRDLLIGEDQGRINSLSVGHGERAVRSMRKFDYVPAATPEAEQDRFAAAHELLRSRQMVLRPMGNLPIRQAVQGPKYAGPRYAPSEDEIRAAELAYDAALTAQSGDHDQLASSKAQEAVRKAGEHLTTLLKRQDEAPKLYEEAKANQLELHKAEKQRLLLEASLSHSLEGCKLDCNYLPVANDDDEVPDSLRSERRIPDVLRSLPPQDTHLLTPEDVIEANLTSKCVACAGPAAKPQLGLPLCGICQVMRTGLTAKCSSCSAPIRPPTEDSASGLCEKCDFACFRCGESAIMSEDGYHIACSTCQLTWRIGVLGYELVRQAKRPVARRQRRTNSTKRQGLEIFGEDEMERLAGRWEVPPRKK